MEVIPVIDLKNGSWCAHEAARATPISRSHPLSPHQRAGGRGRRTARLHSFSHLYIADLDAIERRGDHDRTCAGLRHHSPAWNSRVDNGIGDPEAASAWLQRGLGCLVAGSESDKIYGCCRPCTATIA